MIKELNPDNPLVEEVKKHRKTLVLDEIKRAIELGDKAKPRLDKIAHALEEMNAELCIPLFKEDNLIGLLNLGKRLSEDPYSDEDIDLLTTFGNQLAISIENARLHEEMLEAQKQLLLADKLSSLGRVAAGVAHEIKNPLAAIKGMVQVIGRGKRDEETLKDFEEVVPKEIDRINGLVEDLLKFGRTPEPQFRSVDINEILEHNIKLIENQCKNKKIKINKDLGELPKKQADADQLSQVITNLLLNAVQSMSENGQLTVESKKAGERIRIMIGDTGVGIEKDKIKDIFDPFFTTKKEGTGLGLAIAYKIIKNHKGDIEVESEVGKGTTFKIYL